MTLRDFVRGMLFHDLAKPFFLGGEKHALMGFLFLDAVGLEGEGLAALWHHNLGVSPSGGHDRLQATWEFLEKWKSKGPLQLPRWILHTSVIDQLASSAYSLSEEGPDIQAGSRQNPFTRLPVCHGGFMSSWREKPSSLHQELWDFTGLTASWRYELPDAPRPPGQKLKINQLLDAFHRADVNVLRTDGLEPLLQARDALREYIDGISAMSPRSAYAVFTERTYPSANDTPLLEHGRLCSALALALAINGKRAGDDLSRPLRDAEEARGEITGDWIRLVAQRTIRLIRVRFDGWRDLAERAVRLDDLHGIRMVLGDPAAGETDTWQSTFIRAFSHRLAVAAEEPSLVADILPLNRFAYDLVYLLPGAFSEDVVKRAALNAAEEADSRLADLLRGKYSDDFNRLEFTIGGGTVRAPSMDAAALQRELAFLRPWLSIQEVEEVDAGNFPELKGRFGKALAEAYRRLLTTDSAPVSQLVEPPKDSGIEPDPDEPCAVCGFNGVFEPFYGLYEQLDDDDRNPLEKVMFTQKEEPEKLCRFCLAVRTVSHGALKAPWLRDMVDHDDATGHVVRVSREGGVTPAPALLDRIPVTRGDRIPRDMGACFVRVDKHLEVFPTVFAACDDGGNTVLLRLEANLDGLTRDYAYDAVIEDLNTDDQDAGNLAGHSDAKRFRAVFSRARRELRDCIEKEQDKPEHERRKIDPDMMHPVQLHLARALVRVRWVDETFRSLEQALVADGGIRTLVLESAFPVCHLLVPAADLPRCLEVLAAHLSRRLFSSVAFDRTQNEPDGGLTLDQESLVFLDEALPPTPVLLGAAVVFKARQALYQALRTAREVTRSLKTSEARGLALRFADLRTGLGLVCPTHAGQVDALSLVDLFHLNKALCETDCRCLLRLADLDASEKSEVPAIARARAHLLQAKSGWKDDLKETLRRPEVFSATALVKTAAKSS